MMRELFRISRLGVTKLAFCLVTAGMFLSSAAIAQTTTYECDFCSLFDTLTLIGLGDMSQSASTRSGLAATVYRATYQSALQFAGVAALIASIMVMAKTLLSPEGVGELAVKFATIMVALGVMLVLYSAAGMDALFQAIFDPVQKFPTGVGAWMINASIDKGLLQPVTVTYDGRAIPEGTYAYLWAHVEQVVFRIVYVAAERTESGLFGPLTLTNIQWGLLAVPYVFVAGIFGAFLIQAMFYTVAIATVAPFLFLGLCWSSTRQMVWASLRFLAGAVMTVIFASAAMAFTGFALSQGLDNLEAWLDVGNAMQQIQQKAEAIRLASCSMTGAEMGGGGCTLTEAQAMELAKAQNPQLARAVESDGGNILTFSKEYWFTFLLGFISALIHLAAPRIASNISGAQDSATSAATVVAAGQMVGAKAISAGARAGQWPLGALGSGAGRAAHLGYSKARGGLAEGLANWVGRAGPE